MNVIGCDLFATYKISRETALISFSMTWLLTVPHHLISAYILPKQVPGGSAQTDCVNAAEVICFSGPHMLCTGDIPPNYP